MTYPEALAYLVSARRFGMKLGLDPMRRLSAALGRPHRRLRFVHMAGTNGKGSTAAFCEACLRTAGFRVGLYTSPHLVSVRERIQINREPISESDFAAGLGVVRAAVAMTTDPASTFFELMTGLALWYFARENVAWVVWETGLGGRLDATNIVTPEVAIITNIGLDHQQYLGGTLAEIATEKSGIIKAGVPLVTGVGEGKAREIILGQAARKKSLVSLVNGANPPRDLGLVNGRQQAQIWEGHAPREFELGLIGSHQVENAACAVAAMDHLRWGHAPGFRASDHKLDERAIAQGLAATEWPGRFQIISEAPLIVLDGAHNPSGVACLARTWKAFLAARFLGAKPLTHLVFACAADKDIGELAALLAPLAARISFVQLGHERGADPRVIASFFPGLAPAFHADVAELWKSLEQSPAGEAVLVTGSLFLIGEVLACRSGAAEEFRLNENLAPLPIR